MIEPTVNHSIRASMIEDDERLAELTIRFLASHGVETHRECDGPRGLAAALRGAYDAVQELRRELGDTSVPIDQAAFVAAVLALDLPTVERGLAQGCDPKDGYGAVASPLHQLMYAWDGTQPIESMLTMVRTLVAAGADPEERLFDRWRDEDEFLDVARGATPADLVRSSLAGSNADPALGAQADRLLAALGETREPAARKKPTRR